MPCGVGLPIEFLLFTLVLKRTRAVSQIRAPQINQCADTGCTMNSPPQSIETWLINPIALPAYVATLGAAFFIGASAALTEFSYDASTMNRPVFALLFLTVLSAWLARRGLKIGSAMEALALFTSLSFAAPFCSVILASLEFPLADATLAEVDRQLLFGLEREKIILAFTRHPQVFYGIQLIYNSLLFQPWLLIALLWATKREKRGWLFVSAWAIALAVTMIIFTFVPAIGAPPYYLNYMDTLRHARDGSLRILGTNVLAGIVSFPSFHAAASVMLAWGFAPIPRIGRFFIAWNALMLASAFVASHYFVDLIAGGLVGAVSIWSATHILRRSADDDVAAWRAAKRGALKLSA